jgi:hypothetical protein
LGEGNFLQKVSFPQERGEKNGRNSIFDQYRETVYYVGESEE